MNCQRCGSTDFDEENGLFYCCYCQTQSQGFTQESEQTFIDRSKFRGKEITSKRRHRQKSDQKTGVLWTTTEAFSHILFKQMSNIFEFNSEDIDFNDYKCLTQLLWISYLRKAGLAFTDNETADGKVVRRLHPSTRFRDQQILTNKVDKHLPRFKNASKELGFIDVFKLGADGVVRTVEESEALEDFDRKRTKRELDYDLYDVFNDRYRDPRHYSKSKTYELKISKETQKYLREFMAGIDFEKSFEATLDLLDNENESKLIEDKSDVLNDTEEEAEESKERLSEELNNSMKDKESVISSENLVEMEGKYDSFDKKLLTNLTETTKLFAKHIPLSYLKTSKHLGTDYFIDLMSLPKTLAILNVVHRLLCYDIYCFDLIRWSFEGHIPYKNCLTGLPDDWHFISNDFHTFTSSCVPSHKSINSLSAKIGKYLELTAFPKPNLVRLLLRFAKDFNLPKDIVSIIQLNYNLFDHFNDKLEQKPSDCRTLTSMPFYEGWALMAIVIVLKRVFILNDSTEKRLSLSAKDVKDLFIWDEWEGYTRQRLQLIRSYFVPLYSGNLEDIVDEDLIIDHSLERTEYESTRSISVKKKIKFRRYEFRSNLRQELKNITELVVSEETREPSEPLKPSLYPLTNATNFALNRINSSSIRDEMSISFEDQRMSPWLCSHERTFHRGYTLLAKEPEQWSDSFKLLMELSCIVLNCRSEKLIPILHKMEKMYFGFKAE